VVTGIGVAVGGVLVAIGVTGVTIVGTTVGVGLGVEVENWA